MNRAVRRLRLVDALEEDVVTLSVRRALFAWGFAVGAVVASGWTVLWLLLVS